MKNLPHLLPALILLAGCSVPKTASPIEIRLPARQSVELQLPAEIRGEIQVEPGSKSLVTDPEGWIRFVVTALPDTLLIKGSGQTLLVPTERWKPPFTYVLQSDGTAARRWPWVELRSSAPDTVYQPALNVLFKSLYPARASINGDSVKMYQTGIFFKEVALQEGRNTVVAEAKAPDGSKAVYQREVYFIKKDRDRQPFPLWVDTASVEPAGDQILTPRDRVRIRFNGSKGQQASVVVRPGNQRFPCSEKDMRDYSRYEVDLPLADFKPGKTHRLSVVLEPVGGGASVKPLKINLPTTITVRGEHNFPLVRVIKPKSILSYNLGPVRLGGPIIAEYDPGVVLQTDGQAGDYYRIRLNQIETGFIHRDNVEVLPRQAVKPGYYIGFVRAAAAEGRDVIALPYPEPVPYAIYPEPELKRIRIALYGVKTSSTWMIHKEGLKVVDNLEWRQTTPDTYELIIYLQTAKIWGYELTQNGGNLEFQLKHPPAVRMENGRMKGLVVSIEAGHGGSNLGAEGLSGLLEKDVNLAVALELENICRENGVEVVQIRSRDEYMLLSEKRGRVEASKAHVHVSIHANSGGGGNYLGVSGVSTYYHNPFWAGFAEEMYTHLRELPLKDYGVVGSFNYTVTRIASRPSILVEQAFLSQAEDEEKLASPAFRRQMAEKIFQGIVGYVEQMLEERN